MPIKNKSVVDRRQKNTDHLGSSVTPDSAKLSLIIAQFDRMPALCAALNEVLSDGICAADICILAATQSMLFTGKHGLSSMGENRESIEYIDELQCVCIHSGEITLAGCSGFLFNEITSVYRQLIRKKYKPSHEDCSQLLDKLNRYMVSGGFVLTAITGEPVRLVHTTRTLLRHSSCAVQTQDINYLRPT